MNFFTKTKLLIVVIACLVNAAKGLEIETVQWVGKDSVDFSSLDPAGKEDPGNDNATLYVARGLHRGTLIPGKFSVPLNLTYVGYGGAEFEPAYYEVLVAPVGSLSWVLNVGHNIAPADLIHGGIDPVTFRPLYVCRGAFKDSLVVGRYTTDGANNGTCLVPFDTLEYTVINFEVLVLNAYGVFIKAGHGENLS